MLTLDQLHPLFVHFPIALFSTGLLFDFLAKQLEKDNLAQVGWWNLLIGNLATVFTVATGFIADSMMGHMSLPYNPLKTHGFLELAAFTVLLVIAAVRFRKKMIRYDKGSWVLFVVHSLSVMILFYGAHLGAHLANRI